MEREASEASGTVPSSSTTRNSYSESLEGSVSDPLSGFDLILHLSLNAGVGRTVLWSLTSVFGENVHL